MPFAKDLLHNIFARVISLADKDVAISTRAQLPKIDDPEVHGDLLEDE